jgi:4'-phosphopantetheinyl transferase EntD
LTYSKARKVDVFYEALTVEKKDSSSTPFLYFQLIFSFKQSHFKACFDSNNCHFAL